MEKKAGGTYNLDPYIIRTEIHGQIVYNNQMSGDKNAKSCLPRRVKKSIETGNATLVVKKHNIPQKTVHNWVSKNDRKKSIAKNKSFKLLEEELEKSNS